MNRDDLVLLWHNYFARWKRYVVHDDTKTLRDFRVAVVQYSDLPPTTTVDWLHAAANLAADGNILGRSYEEACDLHALGIRNLDDPLGHF